MHAIQHLDYNTKIYKDDFKFCYFQLIEYSLKVLQHFATINFFIFIYIRKSAFKKRNLCVFIYCSAF